MMHGSVQVLKKACSQSHQRRTEVKTVSGGHGRYIVHHCEVNGWAVANILDIDDCG